MASDRARERRRAARARARAAWQADKGRAIREWRRWRAAVRVGLAPPAMGASARLLRALEAVEDSSFRNALQRFAGLPNRGALAWQRAEVRTQETDWLAVRQNGIRYEIGSALAGEKVKPGSGTGKCALEFAGNANPNLLAGDRAIVMARGRANIIRSTHIRVMASLMLRLEGVRDAR